MAKISTYLHFNGDCAAAFDHYKSIFGGDFSLRMNYEDAPGAEPKGDGANRLIHIALPIGEGTVLLGSDYPTHIPPATIGDNFAVSVDVDTEEEAQRIFAGLASGGQINMPLTKTFWNPCFGMCRDRFGVHWMVGMAPTRAEIRTSESPS